MDAVADRDFAIEFINCCAVTMMHLSRFCEELILWSSVEFSFVEIDDSFSTGSSIMPQKKNPDMAELIRGKSGRVYGDLMSLLTICKGLPLAYNKDLQEDKIPVFDAADTLKASLNIFREMILTMEVKKDNMESAAKYGYMNATDAADYLVSKGIPFRDCHEIIGKIVLHCINKGIAIEEMTMDEFKSFSPAFEEDIYEKIDIRNCIKAKKSKGSTSFASVKKQLEDIEKLRITPETHGAFSTHIHLSAFLTLSSSLLRRLVVLQILYACVDGSFHLVVHSLHQEIIEYFLVLTFQAVCHHRAVLFPFYRHIDRSEPVFHQIIVQSKHCDLSVELWERINIDQLVVDIHCL